MSGTKVLLLPSEKKKVRAATNKHGYSSNNQPGKGGFNPGFLFFMSAIGSSKKEGANKGENRKAEEEVQQIGIDFINSHSLARGVFITASIITLLLALGRLSDIGSGSNS
jgi:hypothetical protein